MEPDKIQLSPGPASVSFGIPLIEFSFQSNRLADVPLPRPIWHPIHYEILTE
jgi:hypothetical protein